eukprot:COSAG03_NODE_10770_length_629_cov_1.058491_1_plen_77_part_10
MAVSRLSRLAIIKVTQSELRKHDFCFEIFGNNHDINSELCLQMNFADQVLSTPQAVAANGAFADLDNGLPERKTTCC